MRHDYNDLGFTDFMQQVTKASQYVNSWSLCSKMVTEMIKNVMRVVSVI